MPTRNSTSIRSRTTKKPSPGMVVAIPLPDGRFAFAKVLEDINYAIFDLIAETIPQLQAVVQHPFSFYLYGNGDSAVKSGAWPILGVDPFASKDAAYAPPVAVFYDRDSNEWSMGGTPWISTRGKERRATLKEVQGLDYLAVSPTPESMVRVIVDRLVHGNHEQYKVRKA